MRYDIYIYVVRGLKVNILLTILNCIGQLYYLA